MRLMGIRVWYDMCIYLTFDSLANARVANFDLHLRSGAAAARDYRISGALGAASSSFACRPRLRGGSVVSLGAQRRSGWPESLRAVPTPTVPTYLLRRARARGVSASHPTPRPAGI